MMPEKTVREIRSTGALIEPPAEMTITHVGRIEAIKRYGPGFRIYFPDGRIDVSVSEAAKFSPGDEVEVTVNIKKA